MKEHFNWVWRQVTTPYLLLLGDDDGVAPAFLTLGKQIIEKRGAAVIKCRAAHVVHEDLGEFFPEGRVLFEKGSTGQLSQISAVNLIREQSANFGFTSNMLSIIPKELIQRIDRRCENWCWGLCPDVTGGRLMLAELSVSPDISFWEIDSPMSLFGTSKHSNAATTILGRGRGRLREFLREGGTGEKQFPNWVDHRVSLGTKTDLLKVDEMIRRYYPGVLIDTDTPNPNAFMPSLLADSLPFQEGGSPSKMGRRWWERRPTAVLLTQECMGRFGREKTVRWLASASVIWLTRMAYKSRRTLTNKVKSSIPVGTRSSVSRILHPISRREIVWSTYRGMGNWDSPRWSSLYLPGAEDVASMPWVPGETRSQME